MVDNNLTENAWLKDVYAIRRRWYLMQIIRLRHISKDNPSGRRSRLDIVRGRRLRRVHDPMGVRRHGSVRHAHITTMRFCIVELEEHTCIVENQVTRCEIALMENQTSGDKYVLHES